MHVRSYGELEPFVSLDGSEIREWAGRVSCPAGGATIEHYHRTSEELYLSERDAARGGRRYQGETSW